MSAGRAAAYLTLGAVGGVIGVGIVGVGYAVQDWQRAARRTRRHQIPATQPARSATT